MLFRSQAELLLGPRYLEKSFHLKNGIWFSHARLSKEGVVDAVDLDFTPFFDAPHIKKVLPIVIVESELFHSLVFYMHHKVVPHAGVETTLHHIQHQFHPVGRARHFIAHFKAHCPKCRLLLRKTVDLELGEFPASRSTVAPPFWSVQIDISPFFKAKTSPVSRKTVPCHALVIVCDLTHATNILAMEIGRAHV